jgi:TPR repeat protein
MSDMSDKNDISDSQSNNNIFLSKDSNNIIESTFKFNIKSPNIIFINDFITKFFNELLQELYIILLNAEVEEICDTKKDKLNEFINNFLFEYDLDPKNVFEIMTSNSQNIYYYSSLIGFFYQNGIGCNVDKIKAYEIFSNAVKNVHQSKSQSNQENEIIFFAKNNINEIIAQYFYSLFLYEDIILYRKDNYKLHKRNAEKGDPVSQYYIGICCHYGKNIDGDYEKSFEWYLKSSEGGNIKATYVLGLRYMLGLRYYNGYYIMKDEEKGFELILKSAEGGHKHASHKVGECYENGICVLKDKRKAFEWYLKAANKGNSHCQHLIANYYNDGIYIPKNEKKAFYWNRKAAINGHYDSQHKLAEYYFNNKNEKKAFNWYLKLANRNSIRAIYLIAKFYRDGNGTDRNLDEASKWFNKYELSKIYGCKLITLNNFLNGLDINAFEIETYKYLS